MIAARRYSSRPLRYRRSVGRWFGDLGFLPWSEAHLLHAEHRYSSRGLSADGAHENDAFRREKLQGTMSAVRETVHESGGSFSSFRGQIHQECDNHENIGPSRKTARFDRP